MVLTMRNSFTHGLSRSKKIKFDRCTKIDYTTLEAIDWSNQTDDGVRINKRHEVGYDIELLEKVNYEKIKWRNDLIHLQLYLFTLLYDVRLYNDQS